MQSNIARTSHDFMGPLQWFPIHSIWSDRRTESENGSGPVTFSCVSKLFHFSSFDLLVLFLYAVKTAFPSHPAWHLEGRTAPWSAKKMLGGQCQRVDIPTHARTAHNGLLQERLEEILCWIVCRVPNSPINQLVEGLNWTEDDLLVLQQNESLTGRDGSCPTFDAVQIRWISILFLRNWTSRPALGA